MAEYKREAGTAAGVAILLAILIGSISIYYFPSQQLLLSETTQGTHGLACREGGPCAALFYFNSATCVGASSISCTLNVTYHGNGPAWSIANATIEVSGAENFTTRTQLLCSTHTGSTTNTTESITTCQSTEVPSSSMIVFGGCGSANYPREEPVMFLCEFDVPLPSSGASLSVAFTLSDGTIVSKYVGYYAG
ncbi:MAG: hypothetical protein ABSB56_03620 [Nitrososphaerales archaeon]|jgi:hypothetical protein